MARGARPRRWRPGLRPRRPPRDLVRLQRLPGPHPAPRRDRRRPRRPGPVRRGQRLGPPHRRGPTGPPGAGGRAGGLEGPGAGRPVRHRLRRQPGRALGGRRSRRHRALRRAEPRLDHRRLPAEPVHGRHLPPPGPRAPVRAAGRRRSGRRGHRHRVLDGRRRRRPGGPRRGVRRPRRAAGAGRGPRRARPGPGAGRRGRGPAGGHAVQDAGLARRLRRGPGRPGRPPGQPGPLLHLHHRLHARRHRRGPGRGPGPAVTGGDRPGGPAAEPCGPGPARPSVAHRPRGPRRRGPGRRRLRRSPGAGPAGPGDPAADGPAR